MHPLVVVQGQARASKEIAWFPALVGENEETGNHSLCDSYHQPRNVFIRRLDMIYFCLNMKKREERLYTSDAATYYHPTSPFLLRTV